MKNLIYLTFICFLAGFSCQNKERESYQITQQNQLVNNIESDSFSEQISIEKLPEPIKEGIYSNELFSGLNISNIVRINKDNKVYYDMTLKDIDGQLIMVYYDEKGKIIVP